MLEPDRTFARRDTALFVLCVALSVGALVRARSRGSTPRRPPPAAPPWPRSSRCSACAEASRTSRTRFDALTRRARLRGRRGPVAAGPPRRERPAARAARPGPPGVAAPGAGGGAAPVAADRRPDAPDRLGARARGSQPFQPVVSPDGLIGAGPHGRRLDRPSSMTWAHPDFRASAVTLDGSVTGIVGVTADATIREPMLELRGVPYRDSVAVGTPVITSGLGGVFPRGLPHRHRRRRGAAVGGVGADLPGAARRGAGAGEPRAGAAAAGGRCLRPAARRGFAPVTRRRAPDGSASGWSCCSWSGCTSTCGRGSGIRASRPTS